LINIQHWKNYLKRILNSRITINELRNKKSRYSYPATKNDLLKATALAPIAAVSFFKGILLPLKKIKPKAGEGS